MTPTILMSCAVPNINVLYVSSVVTGSVMRRADINIRGHDRNVETTIPVAILKQMQQYNLHCFFYEKMPGTTVFREENW